MLKFRYKHPPRRERRCTASSSGLAVPSPLVGEGEDGGPVAVLLPPPESSPARGEEDR
jgi:hypothetical protein